MNITVTITPELKEDLKKAVTQFKVGMAAKVRDDLVESADSAIQKFYKSYDPISYKRHYYNFEKYSFISYYKNPHNSIISGGIELTPELMKDIYYHASPILVFNTVFIAGMHGNIGMANPNAYIPKPMNPTPYEIILKKREYLVSHISNYNKYGFERMLSNQYITINIK